MEMTDEYCYVHSMFPVRLSINEREFTSIGVLTPLAKTHTMGNSARVLGIFFALYTNRAPKVLAAE